MEYKARYDERACGEIVMVKVVASVILDVETGSVGSAGSGLFLLENNWGASPRVMCCL